MPALYDRMVSQIKAQGRDEKAAHAIATAQGQKFGLFKKGTRELTAKGKRQQKAGAAKRAIKRAARRSKGKHKKKDYKYNPKNNVASLKTEENLLECWSTHVQQGYKMKGGKRVPNCVPRSSVKTEARDNSMSNYRKPCSNCGESLQEKNVPTNPSLWSRAKALAKKKFDVYPSAYANGWAAKWYKKRGGGWKKG